ncbi:hypothetical protein EYF80_013372 [Liparis tanakae]|uniref:Uncharacterized protein n=1 Tax=Liparis tanakae TaxID=230148 RepID=A0A4Z2IF97_9TELE|nr:hypothetical protein EYF80_013372 [Liparis tanakae]
MSAERKMIKTQRDGGTVRGRLREKRLRQSFRRQCPSYRSRSGTYITMQTLSHASQLQQQQLTFKEKDENKSPPGDHGWPPHHGDKSVFRYAAAEDKSPDSERFGAEQIQPGRFEVGLHPAQPLNREHVRPRGPG